MSYYSRKDYCRIIGGAMRRIYISRSIIFGFDDIWESVCMEVEQIFEDDWMSRPEMSDFEEKYQKVFERWESQKIRKESKAS